MGSQFLIKVFSSIIWPSFKVMIKIRKRNKIHVQNPATEVLFHHISQEKDQNQTVNNK